MIEDNTEYIHFNNQKWSHDTRVAQSAFDFTKREGLHNFWLIKVPVPSQESEQWCICVLKLSILSLFPW